MSGVIAVLNRDHANIAKLLDLVESEILAVAVGKTPDYPLMQDIMRYMTEYPDRFHHPTEDLVFSQILKRQPGVRANVDELLEEHISIGIAGRKFDSLLRTAGVDSIDVREQLGAASIAYITALREHMSKEEELLFPLATIVLTGRDWELIDEAAIIVSDPLFGETVADEYQRLYRFIADQAEMKPDAISVN